MGPPAGSRPKGKEKEKPKIRNFKRYRIGGVQGLDVLPRIGLQGNPRGIQIWVTRRPGYLRGGAETPGDKGVIEL